MASMRHISLPLALVSVTILAVSVPTLGQANCSGIVSNLIERYYISKSSLSAPMKKVVPENFNGTALVPNEEAFQAAVNKILELASAMANSTIKTLPKGITMENLLSSKAMEDLLKMHLVYTYGLKEPTGPNAVWRNVATAIKPSDKNLCPNGPAASDVDLTLSTAGYTITGPVNNASLTDAEYNKGKDCMNAGAMLIDTVILPCDLKASGLVKTISDAQLAALKANATASKPNTTSSTNAATPLRRMDVAAGGVLLAASMLFGF